MLHRMFFLAALLSALPSIAQSPARGKLIATGWDSPTPAEFTRNLAAFEKFPFDGTTIRPTRVLADGQAVDARFAFSRQHWTSAEFERAIADLQAATPRTSTDNFLMLYANPGDVDWFDDAGWTEIVDHWRLLARVARQGRLKGILFDAEPYAPPHAQFSYPQQPGRKVHTFTQYSAQARKRGCEVMQAVAAEFPDITLFTYRLLCDLRPVADGGGDPAAMLRVEGYGLVPAFVDGWFDALPPTITIVEGNESAYRYNSEAEFDRAFVRLRTQAQLLLSPEHRMKFRSQYTISHGIYLDAHVNPPTSPWHIDRRGGTSAERLEANITAALRASDGFVWIYGETGRWWPADKPKYPLWPERIDGADLALLKAKDPTAAALKRLASATPDENLLRNSLFIESTLEGMPRDWWFWQDEKSKGIGSRDPDSGAAVFGAAKIAGAENACFGQNVKLKPGEAYAVAARVSSAGHGTAGVTVRWKDPAGKWTAEDSDVRLAGSTWGGKSGYREYVGMVRVPPSAGELVVLLAARGQVDKNDTARFDDVRVVPMAPATAAPGLVTISNGAVELAVDPAKGRIIFYGFKGGPNVLWTNPQAPEFADKFGGWLNWGGDKVWVWPQDDWNWPPPIPDLPHEVKRTERAIEMLSPVVPRYGIRIARRIELAKTGTDVTVSSRFIPTDKMPEGGPIAVWAVTQVPASDTVLVRTTANPEIKRIGDPTVGIQQLGDRVIHLKRPGDKSGKVATDGDVFAVTVGDTVLLQRYIRPDRAAGKLEPGTQAQFYAHPDKPDNLPADLPTYMELEWITPSIPRDQLNKVELKIVWTLLKPHEGLTPATLADVVRRLE